MELAAAVRRCHRRCAELASTSADLPGSVDESLRVFGELGERAAGLGGGQRRPVGWHDEDDSEGAFSRAYNYATGSRSASSRRARDKLRETAEGTGQSWSALVIVRTALGFATLGVLSFLQLLASLAFLGPLHCASPWSAQ